MSGHRRSATRKRRSGCCGNLSQHIVENTTYVYHHDAGTRVSRHHKMRERGNPFIDGTYAAGQHHKQVGKSYHACFALGKVGSRDKRIDKPVGTMRKTLRHHTRYVRPGIMSRLGKGVHGSCIGATIHKAMPVAAYPFAKGCRCAHITLVEITAR